MEQENEGSSRLLKRRIKKMGSFWTDARSSAQTCCWQSERQRMFSEGKTKPDLGLDISVCWTSHCASDCKPAPSLCEQSSRLTGTGPFFSLALISFPLNCAGSAPGPFS